MSKHARKRPVSRGIGKGILLRMLGGFVFVVGVGLVVGNRTGAFPTFPYAGFLVMGIGSLIWGAAGGR